TCSHSTPATTTVFPSCFCLTLRFLLFFFFFFQAEDGIRDPLVTGVQTCALPISGFAPAVIEIPDGEEHKNLAWLAVLYDRLLERSEERRVGKECRSRWSADH